MLIGIRHPDGGEAGAEYAKLVSEHLNGKTRIFNPKTYEELQEALDGYRPNLKNHLILLSTHYDLLNDSIPVEVRRVAEFNFSVRGGMVFGEQPENATSAWIGELPKTPRTLAINATTSTNRVIAARRELGAAYVGRTVTDPHTVLVGFKLPKKRVNGIGRQIISSLPQEWGKEGDWSGVGFMPANEPEKLAKAAEWLGEWTSFVALGERAHEALEAAGIAHGAVPIPTGNGRFNNQSTTPLYGFLIRDVAREDKNRLDWKP